MMINATEKTQEELDQLADAQLLDHFAGHALSGLLANLHPFDQSKYNKVADVSYEVADASYEIAIAMMVSRDKAQRKLVERKREELAFKEEQDKRTAEIMANLGAK